jgi:exosome complex RNA-binding protein Rrp42 (RNase PH superfamily)
MTFYSTEEKIFLKQLNSHGIRVDGRRFFDSRYTRIESNIFSTCFSSIRISNGDSSLIFTLKGEVVNNESNFEIQTNFEPKNKDDKESLEILGLVNDLILNRLTHKVLFPNITEYTWKLYIDIFSTEILNISMMQLISQGIINLLKEAEIPKILVFQNQFNKSEKDYIVISNYSESNNMNLNTISSLAENKQINKIDTSQLNDLYFFGISDNNLVLDPCHSELAIITSYVILVLDYKCTIVNLEALRSNIDLKRIEEINKFIDAIKQEKRV